MLAFITVFIFADKYTIVMKMRLAVLASGNGTNAQAIAEAAKEGRLDADVVVFLTNRENAGVIERGRKLGIPVEIVPSNGIKSREEYDLTVVEILKRYDIDVIALAGWMRILSDIFLESFESKIINLHPAILPSFPGGTGIQDAFDYGAKIAGCSVHFVSPVLDGGPLIIQAAVPVAGTREELEENIHRMEHIIFPQALQWFAQGRLEIIGNKTVLHPSRHPVQTISVMDGCLINPPLETK